MNPKLRMLRFAAAVAVPPMLLMACTSSHVPPMNAINMAGDDFDNRLARDYRVLANYESDEMYDFKDANLYADKATASAGGRSPAPDDLSTRRIEGAQNVTELQTARGRLMQSLAAGAAQKSPYNAASAQSNFDCWAEQQEEGHQLDHIAACKNGFQQAMDATETAMAPTPVANAPETTTRPEFFRVLFDWDRSALTADTRRVIDQAIERSRSQGQGIRLIGHTDSTGGDAYNMRLSQRRADAVKAYLIANGIPSRTITTVARGERDLQVETAEDVREAQNRSVSIGFSTRQTAQTGS